MEMFNFFLFSNDFLKFFLLSQLLLSPISTTFILSSNILCTTMSMTHHISPIMHVLIYQIIPPTFIKSIYTLFHIVCFIFLVIIVNVCPFLRTTFNVEIKTNTHQMSMKTWPNCLFLHTNFGFQFYLLSSLRFQKTNKRKISTSIWKEVLQPYLSPSTGFHERVKKYKFFLRKFSIYLVLVD